MTNYVQARITNPSHYYKTPGHVLRDVELGHADKVKILRSMAVDADQKLVATSEGMAGSNPSYTAKELQTALVHLENVKDVEGVEITDAQTARFRHFMVVTTVDQHLNFEIVSVAFDMARALLDGFNRHYRLFRAESSRAKYRFETQDWLVNSAGSASGLSSMTCACWRR